MTEQLRVPGSTPVAFAAGDPADRRGGAGPGLVGHCAERFEQSLAAYRRLERELELLPEPQREQRADELRHLRDRAALHLGQLVVAREVLGYLRHDALFAFYGVPAEVRRRGARSAV